SPGQAAGLHVTKETSRLPSPAHGHRHVRTPTTGAVLTFSNARFAADQHTLAFVDAQPPVRQCARQLSERADIGRVTYRPSPAGGVGGDQFPDQKGGASWPINASTTPPFPLLRLWTTTLPVLPSGSSNVK